MYIQWVLESKCKRRSGTCLSLCMGSFINGKYEVDDRRMKLLEDGIPNRNRTECGTNVNGSFKPHGITVKKERNIGSVFVCLFIFLLFYFAYQVKRNNDNNNVYEKRYEN